MTRVFEWVRPPLSPVGLWWSSVVPLGRLQGIACLVWEGRNERLGPEFYRAVVGQTPEQVLFGDNADRLPIGIEDR